MTTHETVKIEWLANKIIGRLLNSHKLTGRSIKLATAESCTGGLLGGALTMAPNSSAFYTGGIIAYSNEIKMKLLNVSAATLEKHGAVSFETAKEMAVGAALNMGAHIAVSVTGIAGPGGGTLQKPVGLVFFGIHAAGIGTLAFQRFFKGSRTSIRNQAVIFALDEILKIVHEVDKKI